MNNLGTGKISGECVLPTYRFSSESQVVNEGITAPDLRVIDLPDATFTQEVCRVGMFAAT